MDHLIQKCPFKTPNALYQIYRMPHSMARILCQELFSNFPPILFQVRKIFIEKMPRVLFMQRPHYHPKYTHEPGTGTATSSRASSSSSPSSGSAMAEKARKTIETSFWCRDTPQLFAMLFDRPNFNFYEM